MDASLDVPCIMACDNSFILGCGYCLNKKKNSSNIIIGALGNAWGHNFYIGMQNSIRWWSWIFDSCLSIEDVPPRVFPICLYREAMHLQCFTPTRYMATCTHKRDNLYPICSKLLCRVPASIVWLYYACSYTVALFPGIPSFALLHTE